MLFALAEVTEVLQLRVQLDQRQAYVAASSGSRMNRIILEDEIKLLTSMNITNK